MTYLAIGSLAVILAAAVWIAVRPSSIESAATAMVAIEDPSSPIKPLPTAVSLEPMPTTGPSVTAPVVGGAPTTTHAAKLRIDGVDSVAVPNGRGEFSTVPVAGSSVITATVRFPDANPGERISVQAEDGGALIGDAAKGIAELDENRQVTIEFQTSPHDGVHRVTLRRGGESRVLQFWVGPEPPVLARD